LTPGYPLTPLAFLTLVGLLLVAVAAHSPRENRFGNHRGIGGGAGLCSIPTASPGRRKKLKLLEARLKTHGRKRETDFPEAGPPVANQHQDPRSSRMAEAKGDTRPPMTSGGRIRPVNRFPESSNVLVRGRTSCARSLSLSNTVHFLKASHPPAQGDDCELCVATLTGALLTGTVMLYFLRVQGATDECVAAVLEGKLKRGGSDAGGACFDGIRGTH